MIDVMLHMFSNHYDFLYIYSIKTFFFSADWRYFLECFMSINIHRFSYLILSSNLDTDTHFRAFTQILPDQQLVTFKRLKKAL